MFKENENLMAKIAINKSLLKEYRTNSDSRVVYMDNGSEFQIQLFNPEQETIGAEVSINGKVIPGILVIRPGERIWLERYLTERSKFKFSTYEVDDPSENSTVAKAIQNNGEIHIKFYKEKTPNYYTQSPFKCTYDWADVIKPYNSDIAINTVCNSTVSSNANTCINAKSFAKTLSTSTANTNTVMKCCAEINPSDFEHTFSFSDEQKPVMNNISSTIETGRIDKGSYSSQDLQKIDIEFNTYWFKQEIIKILPTSRKQYTANDLQKNYCTECGRKISSKFKYCPFCGTKCVLYYDE